MWSARENTLDFVQRSKPIVLRRVVNVAERSRRAIVDRNARVLFASQERPSAVGHAWLTLSLS